MLKQLSIFMENKQGAMMELLHIIAAEDINVLGYVTNDSAEYGIVRVITSDNEKAMEVLKNRGYLCKNAEILGIEIPDEPGSMADLMAMITAMNINVDYMYLGYSRETNMPMTLIHCEYMDIVANTMRSRGYVVH